jgi:predicted RNase H-like HicB family nuclease
MVYEVYLESGPQHRRTWGFAPSLPGCTWTAPTSEAAIEAAPAAIGERLDFLRRHGEPVAPGPIEVVVADHIIERKVLGFGQQSFPSDADPLTPAELAGHLRWVEWSREELVAALRAQSAPLSEKPEPGRAAATIATHVAEAEWAYVAALLSSPPGRSAAIAALEAALNGLWDRLAAALAAERAPLAARLAEMTPDEMSRVIEKDGRLRWSARRTFRRLLEHEWEHTLELRARVAG